MGWYTNCFTHQELPVGNSAEELVADGTRTWESAGAGGTKADCSFASLQGGRRKDVIVDNLLNKELESETPYWKDKLVDSEKSGEINRTSHVVLCCSAKCCEINTANPST